MFTVEHHYDSSPNVDWLRSLTAKVSLKVPIFLKFVALAKAPEWLLQDDGRFADIQDVAKRSSTNQNIIDRSILVIKTHGNSLRHASI